MTRPDTAAAEAPTSSTDGATRSRGRPREFDADEVLDQLVDLFWEKGFEATSISDIVDATGLNKSSLYNSFGSKDDLFAAALDRYLTSRAAMIFAIAGEGSAGLDDLLRLVDFLQAEMGTDRGRMGCLGVNTSTELGLRDEGAVEMARRLRTDMRAAVGAPLVRAETAGEIRPGTAGDHTETVIAFLLSLSVIGRSGATPTEVDAQFTALRAQIDEWRLP